MHTYSMYLCRIYCTHVIEQYVAEDYIAVFCAELFAWPGNHSQRYDIQECLITTGTVHMYIVCVHACV